MKDPPDHTAEFNAANLLSVGGMIFPKYSLKISSCSLRAESVSLKTIPRSSTLLSCCDKQLQIHTEQKHLLNTFVLLLEYQAYQMFV